MLLDLEKEVELKEHGPRAEHDHSGDRSRSHERDAGHAHLRGEHRQDEHASGRWAKLRHDLSWFRLAARPLRRCSPSEDGCRSGPASRQCAL